MPMSWDPGPVVSGPDRHEYLFWFDIHRTFPLASIIHAPGLVGRGHRVGKKSLLLRSAFGFVDTRRKRT